MKMSMKVSGVEQLKKALAQGVKLEAVKRIVKQNGAELQAKMVRNADFARGYQTGTTKRSISTELSDGGLTSTTGPTTEYAEYVENGTRFMAAQPFVEPAFNEQSKQFIKDMEKLVK
jgi:phage protein, HK97 gp10 family